MARLLKAESAWQMRLSDEQARRYADTLTRLGFSRYEAQAAMRAEYDALPWWKKALANLAAIGASL